MAKKIHNAGFIERLKLRWHFLRYALRGIFNPNWRTIDWLNNHPRTLGADAGSVRLFSKLRKHHGSLVCGPIIRNSPKGDVIYVLSLDAAHQILSADYDEVFGEALLKTEPMALWQSGALATQDGELRRDLRQMNETVMDPGGGPNAIMETVLDAVTDEVARPYARVPVIDFAVFKQLARHLTLRIMFGEQHRSDPLFDSFNPMLKQASRLIRPRPSETYDGFVSQLVSLIEQAPTDTLGGLSRIAFEQTTNRWHPHTQLRHWLFAMHDGLFVHPPRVLALVLSHPQVRTWLMAELDRIDVSRTQDLMHNTPRLTACVEETMRLFTAVPYIVRRCTQPAVIAGFDVPVDTTIMIPAQFLHRDSQSVGARADLFAPQALVERRATGSRSDQPELLIFSAGPRACVGRHVAILLVKALVAQILVKGSLAYEGPPVHRHGRILHTLNNEAVRLTYR